MLKRVFVIMLVAGLIIGLFGLQAAAQQGKGSENGAPRPATQAQFNAASGIPAIIADGETPPPFGPPQGDGNEEGENGLGVTRRIANTNRHLVGERPEDPGQARAIVLEYFIIPIRAFQVYLQADADWNEDESELTITKNGEELILTIEGDRVEAGGEELELEGPAQMASGRTVLLPRYFTDFFAEAE
jgi:hypothetical protein